MIRVHCEALSDFVQNYLLDWRLLSVVAIPLLFGVCFPIYWFLICPAIWNEHPHWFQPRYWMLGYWIFASLVWLVFLAVCFYRTRITPDQDCGSCQRRSRRSRRKKGSSTEDLWNEDKYYPDIHSPEYLVSVSAIQPDRLITEPKVVMDETWEYNYEPKPPRGFPGSPARSQLMQRQNSKSSLLGNGGYRSDQQKLYHSLGYTIHPTLSSSSSSTCGGSSNNSSSTSLYLHHQRLKRKFSDPRDDERDDDQYRRRSASSSSSPQGRRTQSMRHLLAPEASRYNLPRRSASHRATPLGPPVNPRHLRPIRDLTRPIGRNPSVERKKSPLCANDNKTPTSTVIKTPPLTRKLTSPIKNGYPRFPVATSSSDNKTIENILSSSEKKTFESFLKIVPSSPESKETDEEADGEELLRINLSEALQKQNSNVMPDDGSPRSKWSSCESNERKESLSDTKFDLILASLQGLAFELERDFLDDPFEEKSKRLREIVSIPSITGEDEVIMADVTPLSQSY